MKYDNHETDSVSLRPSGFLGETTCRIQTMTCGVAGVCRELNDLSEKLFGPVPVADAPVYAKSTGMSMTMDMNDSLDRLQTVIDDLRNVSERLLTL